MFTDFTFTDRIFGRPPDLRSPWTPSNLENMRMWVDADNLDSFTLNGNSVITWGDLSPVATHPTQTNVNYRPTIVEGFLNNRRVVKFDGVNDFLEVPQVDIARNTNKFSIYAVFRQTGGDGTGAVFVALRSGTAAHRASLSGGCGIGGRRLDSNSYMGTSGGGNCTGGFNIVIGAFDYAAARLHRNVNGTRNTVNPFQTAGSTSNTSSLAVRIGAEASNVLRLNGEIAEIIVFRAVHDTETLQKLEGYLAHKWGLAGNLPVEHPYRAEKPYE